LVLLRKKEENVSEVNEEIDPELTKSWEIVAARKEIDAMVIELALRLVAEKLVTKKLVADPCVRAKEVIVPEEELSWVMVPFVMVPLVIFAFAMVPLEIFALDELKELRVEEVELSWEIDAFVELREEELIEEELRDPKDPLVDNIWEIRAPPGTINAAVDPLTIGSEELMRREPPDEMNDIFNWESVPPTLVTNWLVESSTLVPFEEMSREAIVAELGTTK